MEKAGEINMPKTKVEKREMEPKKNFCWYHFYSMGEDLSGCANFHGFVIDKKDGVNDDDDTESGIQYNIQLSYGDMLKNPKVVDIEANETFFNKKEHKPMYGDNLRERKIPEDVRGDLLALLKEAAAEAEKSFSDKEGYLEVWMSLKDLKIPKKTENTIYYNEWFESFELFGLSTKLGSLIEKGIIDENSKFSALIENDNLNDPEKELIGKLIENDEKFNSEMSIGDATKQINEDVENENN